MKLLIPHVIVLLWVIYIGIMIWQHALQSAQTPPFDPLSYAQKAKNFWSEVHKLKLFNPLNIEPTSRPPGTVLMSYPFGFSSEYKGYFFRSVYLPILLTVLAVYVVTGISVVHEENWKTAALSILFSTIPLFYNFDYNELIVSQTFWGLVDNFQAGIAAIAIAAYLRSFKKHSLFWLVVGSVFASLTLLIKPSGLMVMALLFLTWVLIVAIERFCVKKFETHTYSHCHYAIYGVVIMGLIYSTVIILCVSSKYFSQENFSYARESMKIMAKVLKAPVYQIVVLIFTSVGATLVAWLIFISVSYHLMQSRYSKADSYFENLKYALCAFLIWGLGIWYWLVVQTGGNQVRYFYPFLLMGFICIIPISFEIITRCRRWVLLFEMVLCILPAINMGVLLSLKSPSDQWQRLVGVNVTVGNDREEVDQAYSFLNLLKRLDKNVTMYGFYYGALPDIFMVVGIYEEMIRPNLPVYHPISTVNWISGFVVDLQKLKNADYILVRKDLGWLAEKYSKQPIETYDIESIMFQAWLNSLGANAGVKIVSDGKVLKVLELIDRNAFSLFLSSFVSAHSWRLEFIEVNSQRNG